MKILPKSIRARLKSMREPILEQMAIEQSFQAKLRTTMVTSENEHEVTKARELFEESVKHWEVLKRSLEEYDKLAARKWNITPDTLLVVAGNLVGIILILNKEKADIILSKALGFVLRGRV